MTLATYPISLTINGMPIDGRVPARLTLADYLRDELGLTGTHLGCEQGVCGACTVLVGGRSARACLMLAVQADGEDVRTVEGIGTNDQMTDLQHAFGRWDALQCGFCTPGMLMTATEILMGQVSSWEDVAEGLSGNLCRCTGYAGAIRAVLEVHSRREGRPIE